MDITKIETNTVIDGIIETTIEKTMVETITIVIIDVAIVPITKITIIQDQIQIIMTRDTIEGRKIFVANKQDIKSCEKKRKVYLRYGKREIVFVGSRINNVF